MITNRNEVMDKLTADQKKEYAPFNIGDTVKVHFKIIEGKRERIQVFEGIVLAKKRAGISW